MIYLDSSVVLAALLGEDRRPLDSFWAEELGASWLLRYEVWNRLHARGAPAAAREAAVFLLKGMLLFDLAPNILGRALQPFPQIVKTLDGLHLATMDWLRQCGQAPMLATFDRRLARAAATMGFALWNWDATN